MRQVNRASIDRVFSPSRTAKVSKLADRASAIGVLKAAVAVGVDHIDTAQCYGPSVVNELIREALYP